MFTVTWTQWMSDEMLQDCTNEKSRCKAITEWLSTDLNCRIVCTSVRKARGRDCYQVTVRCGKHAKEYFEAEIGNAVIRRAS